MNWKLFFKAAACWNLSGGLVALLCKEFMTKMFYVNNDGGFCSVESSINYYLLYSFILIMGMGYWMVGNDPSKNKALVIVGILGKMTAAIVWIITFFLGNGTIFLLGGALGDLTWALLFIYFLSRTAKQS
jgi:hypothetical protein